MFANPLYIFTTELRVTDRVFIMAFVITIWDMASKYLHGLCLKGCGTNAIEVPMQTMLERMRYECYRSTHADYA